MVGTVRTLALSIMLGLGACTSPVGAPTSEAVSTLEAPSPSEVRDKGREIVRQHADWVSAFDRLEAVMLGTSKEFDSQKCPECRVGLETETDGKLIEGFEYLARVVDAHGWVSSTGWGKEAETASVDLLASRLVGLGKADASDRVVAFAKSVLADLREGVKTRGVNATSYALIVDSIELYEGRRQVYGSDFTCTGGRFAPYSVLEPDKLNERRAGIGLGPIEAHRYSRNTAMQEYCSSPKDSAR